MVLLVLCLSALLHLTVGAHLPGARIVGGEEAEPHSWKWQVSLQYRILPILFPWQHICGGSLTNDPSVVITAAHCVDGQSLGSLRVVGGLHQQPTTPGNQIRSIEKITMHADYNSTGDGYPNDIATITLSEAFTTTDVNVEGVTLPNTADMDFIDSECWITGWGKTSATSDTSGVLMEAKVAVIKNDVCGDIFKENNVTGAAIYDTHICVFEEGKSACNGDSGGPLVCLVDDEYILAGVTSWGISSCAGFPSVYTRVSKFV